MITTLISVLPLALGQAPEISLDCTLKMRAIEPLIASSQIYLTAPQPSTAASSTTHSAMLPSTSGGIEVGLESNLELGGSARISLAVDFNPNLNQTITTSASGTFRVEFTSPQAVNVLHVISTNSNPQFGTGAFEIDFDGDGQFDWSSSSLTETKKEYQYFGTTYSCLVKIAYTRDSRIPGQKLDTLTLANIPGGQVIEPVRVGVDHHLIDWQRERGRTRFFVNETAIPVVLVVGNQYFPSPVPLGPTPTGPNAQNVSYVPEQFHYLFNWPQPGQPSGLSSFSIRNDLLQSLPALKLQAFVYYPHFFIAGNVLEVGS